MKCTRIVFSFSMVVLITTSAVNADWRRFRGPNGSGVSDESESTPATWTPAENIAWKAPLPGSGVSSPIVVGDRVFVTCYSGYGLDRQDPGDIEDLKRHLLCFDTKTGKPLWAKEIEAVQPEDPYTGIGVTAHGYASHTPASDGERVYAFFGKSGVIAFGLDGTERWRKDVGTGSDDRRWGSSSSPIVFADLLIVTASAESRSLVGLNRETGEEVWRQKADGLGNVWGTPTLVEVQEGRIDLVLGVPYEFWGINPATGKLRWYSEIMETDQYSSSVVVGDGVVYGIEGRGGGSIAVKAGGSGDVTEVSTIWSGNDSARFGSPLLLDGKLFSFSNGVCSCIAATDGSSIFKGRLPNASSAASRSNGSGAGGSGAGDGSERGGNLGGFRGGNRGGGFGRGGFGPMDYASPVAADGKIYYVQSNGTTHVIKASEEFEVIATNKTTEENESFGGTPAISDGMIFLRSDKFLYCIAQ